MSDKTLISYAQNGEDVVLWRALGHVADGRYVDVGACDPVELSVTKALYDRGWRGIDIEAVPWRAERLRQDRGLNEVVQAAITDRPVAEVTFHELVDTGLSTLMDDLAAEHEEAGFERRDVQVPVKTLDAVCEASSLLGGELHVLKIDVEGAEAEVLRSLDLGRWQPWVVVVEATRPLSREPAYAEWDPILVKAGYQFTLFDGLSRYYVSAQHPELVEALSYPACPFDDYVTYRQHLLDVRVDVLTRELDGARSDAMRWRAEAVGYWANAIAEVQKSDDAYQSARAEANGAARQLTRSRTTVRRLREDRQRLRAKVKRVTERRDALAGRVRNLNARVTELEASATPSARSRVGAVLRRVRGA